MSDPLNTLIVSSHRGESNALRSLFCRAPEFAMLPPAYNIEAGISAMGAGCVDVLILDTVWPEHEKDAYDFIAAIDDHLDRPPMLFLLSDVCDEGILQKFQSLGALYCFIKPYDVPEVLRRVRITVNLQGYMSPQEYYTAYFGDTLTDEHIHKEITRHLRNVGMPANLKGYHFIRHAIWLQLRSEDPTCVPVTTFLYPMVAQELSSTATRVERCIRNAIEVTWTRGNLDALHSYFGFTVDDNRGKPTNAEFISMIADRVRYAIPMLDRRNRPHS